MVDGMLVINAPLVDQGRVQKEKSEGGQQVITSLHGTHPLICVEAITIRDAIAPPLFVTVWSEHLHTKVWTNGWWMQLGQRTGRMWEQKKELW